jgi:hypothetical protein
LIRGLLDPSAYRHLTGRVRLIQTHISYVLIAGDFVYKVKKPVNFGFLDFSTLGKRRYYCRREVAFNSRLCADTYLGVVPIRKDGGRFVVGGRAGRIVEYAVQMRRLPEERMMDRLLERGEVTVAMVERVADKLADFHARAETSDRIARYGDWAIRYDWRENVCQWAPFIGRVLTAEQDRLLQAYGEAFFARKAKVLARRVAERRIRHVHADLRSDAVCFTDSSASLRTGGICIFDCVEFSRRLSLLDVGRDVGFLMMDLEYRGHRDLARSFVDRYTDVSGDRDLRQIVDFYAAYSACVRGKVEAFLLDEPEVPATKKRRAQRAARRYFDLACRYAQSLPPAMLIITCGLAGTGKSTLAHAVSEATAFEAVSSDVVRKQLAGLAPEVPRRETFEVGLYAPDVTARTYDALLDRARRSLEDGRSIILDASFLRREYRRRAARLAREAGAQFACLIVRTSEEEAQRRLDQRARRGRSVSDATWGTYKSQKRRFQRPSEVAAGRLIEIDAERPLRSQVRRALEGLRELSPLSVRT